MKKKKLTRLIRNSHPGPPRSPDLNQIELPDRKVKGEVHQTCDDASGVLA